jgi:hypothetical protein
MLLDEARRSNMNLPLVKREICASLDHEITGEIDEEYVVKELSRIRKINPTVFEWISRYMKKTDDETGSAMCAIITYKLLESQAESDRMVAELNLG